MNMPVLKTETASVAAALATAEVVAARRRRSRASCRRSCCRCSATIAARRGAAAGHARAASSTVWQILCMQPGATLPSPTKIWTEACDLIVDPFFVAGPQDIGLGWRVLTSLQRVAIGYGLAAVIGIAARHADRPVGLGDARARPDLPGAAHDLAARLAADLARRVPRQPAVGDLRDLHHLGLADHHQHRGRHPQHPAGLPQRRGGAAAQPARVLLEDHDPVGGALHLHRACASASACPGSPSSRRKC